ncbi:hypothetical protein [Streptomyces sp. NPDC049040]|uniref:hypothetical protein n=1 Tax=Streptomyces sp. NPDC049040 TaxID=3365593 RepID=UPI00371809BB
MSDFVPLDAPRRPYDPGGGPVSQGWVSALVSSLVTVSSAVLLLVWVGFSPMACDSCDEAQARRFTASFGPASHVFFAGLGLSMLLLLTSWALPWRQRNVATRSVTALLAPIPVIVGFVLFRQMVDWPRGT